MCTWLFCGHIGTCELGAQSLARAGAELYISCAGWLYLPLAGISPRPSTASIGGQPGRPSIAMEILSKHEPPHLHGWTNSPVMFESVMLT